jgi:hypothetical protein
MKIKTISVRDETVRYLILKVLNAIVDEMFYHFIVTGKKEACVPTDQKIEALNNFLKKVAFNKPEDHETYAGITAEISTVIKIIGAEKKLAAFLFDLSHEVLKKLKIHNVEGFINEYHEEKEAN